MDTNENVNITWSNMNIWQEKANNVWKKTSKTTWPQIDNITQFTWPNHKQAMGALHSNGAMLYRGKFAKNYIIPDACDFNIMEAVRERTFEFPIYLTSRLLANFSQTLKTNRSDNTLFWTGGQILLLGSFIQASSNKNGLYSETLNAYRTQKPSPIANFFLANLFILKNKTLYKFFTIYDWMLIGKWLVINGYKLRHIKLYLTSQEETYQFLLKSTYHRFN